MSASGGARLGQGRDGIAEVVLDRPEAMNALNTATLLDLAGLFSALGADPAVRVVVLTGEGERAFCVGADLKERAAMSDEQIMAQRPAFRAAFGALLALPQPAIAAVHGYALGGGCELALELRHDRGRPDRGARPARGERRARPWLRRHATAGPPGRARAGPPN